jgi:glutaredoxin
VGLLDKLGHAALNALDAAARYADDVRERKAAAEATTPLPAEPAPKPKPQRAPAPAENELGDKEIPVQVFGRMSCPWTQRALRLLGDRSIEHVYIELAAPGGYQLVPRLSAATGQRSVPYIYVRGQFVGGYDGLDEIDRLGQLDEMIKTEEERAASGGQNRIRIQVATRPKGG